MPAAPFYTMAELRRAHDSITQQGQNLVQVAGLTGRDPHGLREALIRGLRFDYREYRAAERAERAAAIRATYRQTRSLKKTSQIHRCSPSDVSAIVRLHGEKLQRTLEALALGQATTAQMQARLDRCRATVAPRLEELARQGLALKSKRGRRVVWTLTDAGRDKLAALRSTA